MMISRNASTKDFSITLYNLHQEDHNEFKL